MRYAYRLHGALKRSEFSLLHRRALDRFAQKNGMSSGETLSIENATRSRLKMPPLDWEKELRSVIADLKEQHDSLTTLRKQLRQTYVRSDRLADATFQGVYSNPQPQPVEAPAPAEPAQSQWLWMAGVGLLGLLGLGAAFGM